ncbi:Lrp/AsnC family transcriptional regulator [Nocardia sp. NBC_01329]|uniref:Lrp/AsnC family transcriptional regulator n=1 Tax=Nocardia sp. NBC_01329 TaxID=2903594 RepID=UPI002E0E9751|nr:Lrp/AsnC family transcriptional regulator [Nocardia sp. NBC_01329]
MTSPETTEAVVDATDARLLLELIANPRATGVELATRLGLSRNTVQARITRWEATGVLGSFERRVEPRALGYRLSAFVAVVVDQHRLEAVVGELAEIPEVTEVCGMTGPTDLTVRVVARDADDLYRITGQILKIPGVVRTNMALVMQESVGPRIAPLLHRLAEVSRPSGNPRSGPRTGAGTSSPAQGRDQETGRDID